jgi:alpha-D-xyloside xylohydrolase/alpha-glucosidase
MRLALVVVVAAGCANPPVELALSDVVLRVEPSGRILATRPDGRMILDGLAGGGVAKHQPPHVGLAFEQASPEWSELYGNFQITDSDPAWQGVRGFHDLTKLADGISFAVDGPDGGGSGSIRRVADGTLALSVTAPRQTRASAAFRCAADERFLGFGAMPMDVEHRGATVPSWVSEEGVGRVPTDDQPGDWFLRGTRHQSYFPVPFFVSSHDYGVRADTSYRSVFAMCSESEDAWRVEAWEGTLALHIFYGDTPLDVIQRHSDFEGRAPPPPPFTWAPWNDAIFGSASVRAVAAELRDNHIPSSVIWTEDWAGGESDGAGGYSLPYNWTVDRTLYPDVEQVAQELHGGGFKWLAYFNTFVVSDGPNFAAGSAGGYLVEKSDGTPHLLDGVPLGKQDALVDLTNDAAQKWTADALNAALDLGFDGWMADYGEWLPVDAKLASGAPGEAAHNDYPLAWQKLNEQVLTERGDGVDRLVFVRSGHNGNQAVTHQVVWGGDQTSDWDPGDGLPSVLPLMLGLGVAGLPYFGSDIGGYFTGNGHPSSTKELFFRWSVLGALSPIMRTHHSTMPMLAWRFDSDAETLAHWKRWATLHTQLYPYLAALAAEAASDGAPMARQLALGFPDDAAAWTTADEYLLGPSLLVAPVLAEGATDRTVYFPAGHWLPLFGFAGAAVDGPASVGVMAPLGELPVYARAGTVLALLPDGVDTLAPAAPPLVGLDQVGDDRELIALGGAGGSFVEVGGQSYTLISTGAPDSATVTWNGAALAACDATPVAPCGSINGAQAEAYLVGDGTLAAGSTTLTTSGGRPARALHLRLNW